MIQALLCSGVKTHFFLPSPCLSSYHAQSFSLRSWVFFVMIVGPEKPSVTYSLHALNDFFKKQWPPRSVCLHVRKQQHVYSTYI